MVKTRVTGELLSKSAEGKRNGSIRKSVKQK